MKTVAVTLLMLLSVHSFANDRDMQAGIEALKEHAQTQARLAALNKESTQAPNGNTQALNFPTVSRELQASWQAVAGGTNIGGGENGSEFTAEWCRDQIGKLYAFKERAQLKLNMSGDYFQSNQILLKGLIAGIQSSGGNMSFTNRALLRGVELFNAMGVNQIGLSNREKRNLNRVMKLYYTFITSYIAVDLDLEGFVKLQKAVEEDNLAAFDSNEFETRIISYASTQLSWLIDAFMTTDGFEYMSIGKSKDFRKAAEILLEGVKNDVNDSLHRYRLSCAIQKLTSLSQIVKQYNLGNRELFENDRLAENYIVGQVNEIITAINTGETCF